LQMPPTLSALVTPNRKTSRSSTIRSPTEKTPISSLFSRASPYSPSSISVKATQPSTPPPFSQSNLTIEINSSFERPQSARLLFQSPSPQSGESSPSESSTSTYSPSLKDLTVDTNSRTITPEPSPPSVSPSPISRWFAQFFRRRPSQDPWSLIGKNSSTQSNISPPISSPSSTSPSFSSSPPSFHYPRDRSSSVPSRISPLLTTKVDNSFVTYTQKKKESTCSRRNRKTGHEDNVDMVCDDMVDI